MFTNLGSLVTRTRETGELYSMAWGQGNFTFSIDHIGLKMSGVSRSDSCLSNTDKVNLKTCFKFSSLNIYIYQCYIETPPYTTPLFWRELILPPALGNFHSVSKISPPRMTAGGWVRPTADNLCYRRGLKGKRGRECQASYFEDGRNQSSISSSLL